MSRGRCAARWALVCAPVVAFLACTADVRLGDLAEPQGTAQDGAAEAASSDASLVADASKVVDARVSDATGDSARGADAADASDGACAIDCHGNPCVGNVCQPLTLASGRKSPLYLAIDATDVFYTEFGHAGTLADPNPVSRVGKDGGATTTLAQDDGSPRGIAVDATTVFWNDAAEGGAENVWRASKVDGSSAVITGRIPTPVDIQGIALGQNLVYAASGTEVRYFGKTANMSFGNEATNVLNHVIGIAATTDDTFVFAADLGNANLGVLDLGGMTTTPVAVGNSPIDVAIDADYAFLATGAEIVRVSRADKSTLVLATGLDGASGVAVDVDTVYFVTKTEVRKVPKLGGASRVIGAGLSHGGRIVVDGMYAFYTDVLAGIIGRVPK